MVKVIIGADASRITQSIVEELDQYVKYKNGEIYKEFVSIQYGICIFVHGQLLTLSYTQILNCYKLRYQ